MPEVIARDGVRLHVEVDGEGPPVTVFAHGLTNSCAELSAFTPAAPGTKVRFCFRGHGHSDVPPPGSSRFVDFAGDVDAVARAYGATRAVGTSLGAGAITHLLGQDPGRFERLVFVLPAALDVPLAAGSQADYERTAELLETLPTDQAIDRILEASGRVEEYRERPWLREVDLLLWQDLNPTGVARAIREVTRDVAIADRELLRRVEAPAIVIGREGDEIHPAALARVLAELLANAELILLSSEDELLAAIPMLVQRVSAFLEEGS
ncbi:MAG TPA: alpha/beta hydrolase [Actinomycetota bacterium]|nr:alpha/beta hydrolase [Actinomycetota bacterium]